MNVVGILGENNPMVSMMKVDKAPLESYANIADVKSKSKR